MTSSGFARKVVCTGLGIVSPLGVGVQHCWIQLINGKSGLVRLPSEEGYASLPSKVAALVPEGQEHPWQFDKNRFAPSEWRQMSKSTAFALVAAGEALKDADWLPDNDKDREDTGVTMGTGMVDLVDVHETANTFANKGYSKVSPYFIPRILPNMASGQICIKYKLRGPNHSVTTACATGAHAVGDAYNMIKHGKAEVMICGGTEASISPLGVAGFCRLRALSTRFNDEPSRASRPFDQDRDGFVIGEGAGVLVLESLQHALERKVKRIYAEVIGYGLSGDGYHLTSPDKEGRGAYLSMKRCLEEAQLGDKLSEIGYINAHATSTPQGDEIESRAIRRLIPREDGHNLMVSSTKGATGHLLGAAGAVEALFTVLSVYHGIAPPTLNFCKADVDLGLNYVPNNCLEFPNSVLMQKRTAITNSFGFGGTNVSLCFTDFI